MPYLITFENILHRRSTLNSSNIFGFHNGSNMTSPWASATDWNIKRNLKTGETPCLCCWPNLMTFHCILTCWWYEELYRFLCLPLSQFRVFSTLASLESVFLKICQSDVCEHLHNCSPWMCGFTDRATFLDFFVLILISEFNPLHNGKKRYLKLMTRIVQKWNALSEKWLCQ